MLPELGHFALILALLLAGVQAFFGLAAPALHRDRWLAAVVPAAVSYLPSMLLTYATMLAAWVLFRADDLPQAMDFFRGVSFCADWSGTPKPWTQAAGAAEAGLNRMKAIAQLVGRIC